MALSIAAAVIGSGLGAQTPATPVHADVRLWRLDCGRIRANDAAPFSDTGRYDGRRLELSDGCYLVRHGRDLVLWHAGLPLALLNAPASNDAVSPTLAADLPSQLRAIGYGPADVKWLVISHYHWDHVGQAAAFPGATLLVGEEDWKALHSADPPFGSDPTLLGHWLKGGGKVDAFAGDRDVFGDGSVVILAVPGHTPGAKALLVRLRGRGNVILSGDALMQAGTDAASGVPTWNTSRADSLASADRLRTLATNLHATLIVQHDVHDVAKLPRFPSAAQ